MLILPRNIQVLACCAGACLQSSFCTWGNFNRRKWGFFNRRKLGNIQLALTTAAPMPIKAPYALPDEQTKSALEIDEFQGRRRI